MRREKHLLRLAVHDLFQMIVTELDRDPIPDVGAYIPDIEVAKAARKAVAKVSK